MLVLVEIGKRQERELLIKLTKKNNFEEQNGWMPNRPSCIVSTAFSSFLILFYVPLSRPTSPILSVYPSHRPLVTLKLETLTILSNIYEEKNVCLCLEFKLLVKWIGQVWKRNQSGKMNQIFNFLQIFGHISQTSKYLCSFLKILIQLPQILNIFVVIKAAIFCIKQLTFALNWKSCPVY